MKGTGNKFQARKNNEKEATKCMKHTKFKTQLEIVCLEVVSRLKEILHFTHVLSITNEYSVIFRYPRYLESIFSIDLEFKRFA